jgi:hypothetical protein
MQTAGKEGRVEDLERWGAELLRILAIRTRLASSRLDVALIRAIKWAAEAHVQLGDAQGFSRWFNILRRLNSSLSRKAPSGVRGALAESTSDILLGFVSLGNIRGVELAAQELERLERLDPTDAVVASEAARGLESLACAYGQLGRISKMRRCADRLINRMRSDNFRFDPGMRLYEASVLADVIGHYGHHQRFAEVEQAAAELVLLTRDSSFEEIVSFRLKEAEGTSAAMKAYSLLGSLESIERWGGELHAVAVDPRFVSDPDMRFRLLHGTSSAIQGYGVAEKLDDMLRWAKVAEDTSEDIRFAFSAAVQEAITTIAVSFTAIAGGAGLFDEVEKWGAIVTKIAQNPLFEENFHIHGRVAMVYGNIINRYSNAGADLSTLIAWRRLLALHAQRYAYHPEVQEVATHTGLNFTQQLLDHFRFGKVDCVSRLSKPAIGRGRQAHLQFAYD